MATESIANRANDIDDPNTARSINALLQSVLLDLAALKAAHNAHTHTTVVTATGASAIASSVPATNLVGNLNTTA